VQKVLTKKSEQMAFVDLEDTSGLIEVIVFPGLYNQSKTLITDGKILIVKGKLSDKDGVPKFIADEIKEFGQQTLPTQTSAVTIKIPEAATDELFEELKNLFETSPGDLSVNLQIREQKIKTPFRINLDDDLKSKIKKLLE
jgi:DNA polymerase-3 subunit alpha